jgi:hypothetical protein
MVPPGLMLSQVRSAQIFTSYFFVFLGGRLEWYVAACRPFVFLRDVWIRTQRAAMASRRTTHLSYARI